jgi:hypothetical protein
MGCRAPAGNPLERVRQLAYKTAACRPSFADADTIALLLRLRFWTLFVRATDACKAAGCPYHALAPWRLRSGLRAACLVVDDDSDGPNGVACHAAAESIAGRTAQSRHRTDYPARHNSKLFRFCGRADHPAGYQSETVFTDNAANGYSHVCHDGDPDANSRGHDIRTGSGDNNSLAHRDGAEEYRHGHCAGLTRNAPVTAGATHFGNDVCHAGGTSARSALSADFSDSRTDHLG